METGSAEFRRWLTEANAAAEEHVADRLDPEQELLAFKRRAWAQAATSSTLESGSTTAPPSSPQAALATATDMMVRASLRGTEPTGNLNRLLLHYMAQHEDHRTVASSPPIPARRWRLPKTIWAISATMLLPFLVTTALWEWRGFAATLTITFFAVSAASFAAAVLARGALYKEMRERQHPRLPLSELTGCRLPARIEFGGYIDADPVEASDESPDETEEPEAPPLRRPASTTERPGTTLTRIAGSAQPRRRAARRGTTLRPPRTT